MLTSVESLVGQDKSSSDNDLLEAIAEGDARAFAILLNRYLPKMVALARRITLDLSEANEIAQEAFLRVWKHAAAWDPDGTATFETWLHRIVINLAISSRRKRRDTVTLEVVAEKADDSPDGFDLIAAADRQKAVQRALGQLPERQRAAVAAFYFDDISHAEAAKRMDLNPKAFDGLLVRARKNLRKYLEPLGLERDGGDYE